MLGERFEKLNRGVISNSKKGIDPFEFSKNELVASDLNIGNLECVVSASSQKSFPFSKFMKLEPEQLHYLIDNNISVVNIANNHIFDHGEQAFFETRENLEKHNIKYFGFDSGTGIQKDPLELKIQNRTLAIFGFDLSNYNRKKFDKRIDEIVEIISSVKGKYDISVLSLHWGYEYSDSPTSFMIKAAEKFFDNGIDIMYGHHPHILHGVTILGGKIFAPSLGNFIFDDERERNRQTGILQVQINETNILSYNFSTYFCNKNFQPIYSRDLQKKFEELSKLLEENIAKTGKGDFSFDEKIFNDSEKGHLNNMKRVRKEIMKNFYSYAPYIPQILKSKVIDKRLKKIFN